jgi:hypothetical protein
MHSFLTSYRSARNFTFRSRSLRDGLPVPDLGKMFPSGKRHISRAAQASQRWMMTATCSVVMSMITLPAHRDFLVYLFGPPLHDSRVSVRGFTSASGMPTRGIN